MMTEESLFDSAMVSLKKPQETRRLLKILVALRKEMEWPKDKLNMLKFYDTGCMKHIIVAMQRDSGTVLDVCLSILGNCAMERYISRNLVQVYNLLPILGKLLKQHQTNDCVHGRIFRIVGNLSQHWERFSRTIFDQEPELIKHIIDYMKKSATSNTTDSSDATVNMGIRAFREMLNCETVDSLVNRHEVLQTIGLVLIKYSAKWREAKTHEDLLLNIVRLLHDYSRFRHTRSVLYLRNTGGGDSLQCLSDLTFIAPKKVVKIVMNLITISSLKSDLPVPDICGSLQMLIKQQVVKDRGNPILKEYIQSLCSLFDHPANRCNDRNKGSIPFLIEILKELNLQAAYAAVITTNSDRQDKSLISYYPLILQLECCIIIIVTLQKCMYDESLVALQVKHDIIGTLVEKLEWITGTSNSLNLKHEIKKEIVVTDITAPNNKRRRINYKETIHGAYDMFMTLEEWSDCLYSPYNERPSSPSASSDISFYSGGRSPSSSSLGAGEVNSGSDSDDDYSPVCSEYEDNDQDETEEIKEVLEKEIEKLPEENEVQEAIVAEETQPLEDKRLSTVQNLLIHEAVRLLKWFSKIRPSIQQLGTMRVVKMLLKTTKGISYCSTSDNISIILEILEVQDYLLPLLQTNFIPMVYELLILQHRGCLVCKEYQKMGQLILGRLTILAESSCGKGDIAHQLMRASDNTKQNLVLVLPYIIRNKSTLSKFMVSCGGLEVLMKLLEDDTELQRRSIKTLCMMALKKLRIKNPRNAIEATTTEEIYIPNIYVPPKLSTNLVTFKLDDGSVISTNRDFLSEKSDFFNTLLCGQFKESCQNEISLRNVDEKTFKCLLNLLNCNLDRSVLLKVDLDLATLLDVILLADKYLLVDLCNSLIETVEKFRMSPKSIPRIYQWSVESGTNILRIETIAFALVANIADNERFLMFKNLFDLGLSKELVGDIRKLLGRFLSASVYCEIIAIE